MKSPRPTMRERLRDSSIRLRLVLAFVAVVVLTALAITVGAIAEGFRNGYRQAINQLASVATLKEAEIDAWVRGLQRGLRAEALRSSHPAWIRSLLRVAPSPEESEDAYRRLGEAFRESIVLRERFAELFLMDRRGWVVLASNPAMEGQFRGLQKYFREGLKAPGVHVQTLSFSSTSEGLNALIAVLPVKDEAGEVIGVLAGSASPATLNRIMVERTGLGETGETYLVGMNHVLLTESRFPGYAVGGTAVYSAGINAALRERASGSGLYADYRHVPVFGAWRWLPEVQVALAAEQDRAEVLSSMYRLVAVDLSIALAAVLAALVVSILIARSIARPLASLAEVAGQIAGGNLNLMAKVERHDEIGALAEAFNSMTRQLRELFMGLRQRVDELQRTSDALRASQTLYHDLVETSQDLIWQCDVEGRFTYVNAAWEEALGYPVAEMLGRRFTDFQDPEVVQGNMAAYKRCLWDGGAVRGIEIKYRRRDGREACFVFNAKVVMDDQGRSVGIRGTAYDISERHKLQEQLEHARKMESVGRLAGGVAHDFNNMLGVIIGSVELALLEAAPDSPLHIHLCEIRAAAQRSAALTRQLLAFARKQVVSPRVVDLNDTVGAILTMLHRLIGEGIRLDWQPQPGLWPVRIDPSQVDQMLTNLCLNARDAMGGKGTIILRAENRVVGETDCADTVEFAPGEYVLLSVADDGCGMDKATLAHLFEPFFTTKAVGEGTGLGLAMVYGAVKQNQGFVHVASEPGQGTVFEIYLPRDRQAEGTQFAKPDDAPAAAMRGEGTVLLVEDEPAVLRLTQRMLAGLGYAVLATGSPEEAFRLAEQHAGTIDLLLTDIVMAGLNGHDLATRLRSRHPGLKVLFMSGHTADFIARQGMLEEGVSFLHKPFVMSELSTRIRDVLSH